MSSIFLDASDAEGLCHLGYYIIHPPVRCYQFDPSTLEWVCDLLDGEPLLLPDEAVQNKLVQSKFHDNVIIVCYEDHMFSLVSEDIRYVQPML